MKRLATTPCCSNQACKPIGSSPYQWTATFEAYIKCEKKCVPTFHHLMKDMAWERTSVVAEYFLAVPISGPPSTHSSRVNQVSLAKSNVPNKAPPNQTLVWQSIFGVRTLTVSTLTSRGIPYKTFSSNTSASPGGLAPPPTRMMLAKSFCCRSIREQRRILSTMAMCKPASASFVSTHGEASRVQVGPSLLSSPLASWIERRIPALADFCVRVSFPTYSSNTTSGSCCLSYGAAGLTAKPFAKPCSTFG
mmetsp:Transcript_10933/g.67549  ORF Transcript_10933/g.67549 Transcript_10933/m.67549 type:complete len:249 (-) Transcript_10933:1123-1869(-)